MSNRGSIIRLVVSAAVCMAIICYSAYSFLFADVSEKGSAFIPIGGYYGNIFSGENQSGEALPESESENGENISGQPKENGSSTVPAASSGAVKGKINEKFSSPYTANTSYNNVYLKNSAGVDINLKELLSSPLKYKIEKNNEPQVLIVHTHTTETFMTESRDYYTENDLARTTDNTKNMVHLGEMIASRLNAEGIKTIHDTTVHDYPEYNGSYTRSAATIKKNLKKYPGIKIVLDMHRDAVSSNGTKSKLVTEIDGKKAAQIMLVMGSQSGNITNFPNWQENLKLAVRLQQTVEVMYPSLARAVSLVSRNYNESLTTGSLLIEMGTDANTLEEVGYSAELLGNALCSLLNTLT